MKTLINAPRLNRNLARKTVQTMREKFDINGYCKMKVIDKGQELKSIDRWSVGLVLLTDTLKLLKPVSGNRHSFVLNQVKHNGRDQRAYNQSKKVEKHHVNVIVKPSRQLVY